MKTPRPIVVLRLLPVVGLVAVFTQVLAPLPGGLICNGNCPGLATTQQMIELAIIATVAALVTAWVCAKLWRNDRQRARNMVEEQD